MSYHGANKEQAAKHAMKAVVWWYQGHKANAIEECKKALELDPDCKAAIELLKQIKEQI